MGSENKVSQIPFFDFCSDPRVGEEGSEGWELLCKEVRAACEEYGCFEVGYDAVPVELRKEMFEAMKSLFDLPVETKKKNCNSLPFHGYVGQFPGVPLYEALGVEHAPTIDGSRAFTDLMWPQGNPEFCNTVNSMSKKLRELEILVRKMIFDSYGVGREYHDWHVENSVGLFRMNNYKAPGENLATGLPPHTDRDIITLLCINEIEGLQILSKEGDWIHLNPHPGSFVIIIGDSFKAWSNGRLHSVRHQVVMRGEKERFSFGLFTYPNEKMTIEAPQELVDKDHPLLFKPFKYHDFISFIYTDINNIKLPDALQTFAGV